MWTEQKITDSLRTEIMTDLNTASYLHPLAPGPLLSWVGPGDEANTGFIVRCHT